MRTVNRELVRITWARPTEDLRRKRKPPASTLGVSILRKIEGQIEPRTYSSYPQPR